VGTLKTANVVATADGGAGGVDAATEETEEVTAGAKAVTVGTSLASPSP
jgi:dihydroorotate dehydrogenase